MTGPRTHALSLCLLFACASGGGSARPDAGTPDAGEPDAQTMPDGGVDECGDVRQTKPSESMSLVDGGAHPVDGGVRPLVYFGTDAPTVMPLTEGQLLAIAYLPESGCSATFITHDWVLTAKHCPVSDNDRVLVGPTPSDPGPQDPTVVFRVAQNVPHPMYDVRLLRVHQSARTLLPALVPIPISKTQLDTRWIGRIAEAAGYGYLEDGITYGIRKFAAEPVLRFETRVQGSTTNELIAIDGQGVRGVCNGDSGGPLFILDDNAAVRVAGGLYFGTRNCVGIDRYTRSDFFADWIEGYTGPTPAPIVQPCGSYTSEGRCVGGTAIWCEDGRLRAVKCSQLCSFDGIVGGNRCVRADQSCLGITEEGTCAGNVARWCENGRLRQSDCGSCGRQCVNTPEMGGVGCLDSCQGIDARGECDASGDIATWCFEGRIQIRDCRDTNQVCGFIESLDQYGCHDRLPAT